MFVIYAASGASWATWASRLPAIKDNLGIDNIQVGAGLLITGAASIIGLTLSPVVMARFGTRSGMLGAMLVLAVGVATVGLGTDSVRSYAVVVVGLALFGVSVGALDVMMNVDGAMIERQLGKTLLPLLHAFFSVGTVLGAGVGVLAISGGLSVLVHTAAAAGVIVVAAFVSIANVPGRAQTLDSAPTKQPSRQWRVRLHESLAPWREPRTYVLGLVILGMAFAEGGANDWLALAMVEGHGTDQALGAAGLAVFSVSMTLVRVVGGPLVDRFGRVATLRVLAVTAGGGLLLFILAPSVPLALVGAALWGAGTSLGFPLGMSAAADDPARAAARVGAAAMIGYLAFLCGPPVLGFVSEQIGLLNTLYIIVGLIVASGLASGATRPLPGAHLGEGHRKGHDATR